MNTTEILIIRLYNRHSISVTRALLNTRSQASQRQPATTRALLDCLTYMILNSQQSVQCQK